MKNIKQYYKELGKAVYAVAIADGVITPEERETLHHFVLKNLVSHETGEDSSHMNEAFYVDFEFDAAASGHTNAKEAIKSYVRFLHANTEAGDQGLIDRSVDVLEKVATTYSRSGERALLQEIQSEIKEVLR